MRRRRARRIRYRPGNRPRLRMPRLFLPFRRRRQYRVVNRRRLFAFQGVLALIAATALGLSISVIVTSVRTARLNRELEAMHTVHGDTLEVEVAAPPIENLATHTQGASRNSTSSSLGKLSSMTMPDGSPIVPLEMDGAPEQDVDLSTVVFHRTDLEILPDMLELANKNPDTIGWIGISGTVHLPVVYRDNSYYLDHDFYGRKSKAGTLFLDEAHPLTDTTQNLLIHGHAMNDGSMFGILTHYGRLDFLQKHALISFSTLWEKETYAVFAVLQVSSKTEDENYFNYYSNPDFASNEEFDEYINQLLERSKFSIPVDVRPTDALLTLSTCLDDDRLVVIARRMRPDESRDELISAVETAYKS